MAERLQSVESTRRQLFGDLAHEIRTPVSVLEAYLEAVEDGVKTLDPPTIAMLREQTGRLVRFSADFAALAKARRGNLGAGLAPAPANPRRRGLLSPAAFFCFRQPPLPAHAASMALTSTRRTIF
jgi:signal transduction histidine kinase